MHTCSGDVPLGSPDRGAVNTGEVAWEPGNEHGIAVGAQWRHPDGRFVQDGDEGRVHVRVPVPPGGVLRGTLVLRSPVVPGRYRLYVDQEEVAWFHDRGNQPSVGEVEVGAVRAREAARRVLDLLGPVGRAVDRARGRVGVLAPPAPGPAPPAPVMEMHGLPRAEVEAVVAAAGGRVVFVQDDPSAPGWVGYTYWITR